jgi:hypothetical protein
MDTLSITSSILDIIGVFWEEEIGTPRKKISYGDLILALVEESSYERVPGRLNLSLKTLERILVILRDKVRKPLKVSWDTYLLLYVDLGKCPKCSKIQPLKDINNSRGYLCKACDCASSQEYRRTKDIEIFRLKSRVHYSSNKDKYIARNAIKRNRIKQATPKWANLVEIQDFYLSRPEGHHVDHIIPLKGESVCGLHVIENLQYLSAFDNLSKGNKFTG